MYSCLLREENRFTEYENVLDVKCTQNTTCVFGIDDYVKIFMNMMNANYQFVDFIN